jgi:hypothetical protein
MAKLTNAAINWRMLWRAWGRAMAFVFFFALGGAQSAIAETDRPEIERQVKAAYLYKFGSYVEWPERAFARPDSPLQIGIMGADALADELTALTAGRTVNGRPVLVKKLRREDSTTGINVLFIGRSNVSRIPEILAAARGQPMLTVTESEDALSLGSMINFVAVDGKVRFEVAPRAAGQGQLSISARLLAAAYKVASGAS